MAREVSFRISMKDRALVRRIVSRANQAGLVEDRLSSEMDLTATHANGNRMDFARLLAADNFNFVHDFCGIARHLDRATGKLGDHFRPRFSQRERAAA